MVEAVTWSFIAKPAAELFGGGSLSWRSPIRSRPICPTCGRACCRAWSRRRRPMPTAALADVALFEVGQIFKGDKPEDQLVAAAGVRHGFASSKGMGRHWSGSADADALDAKADAFAVLAAAGAPMQALQIVPGGARLAASGTFRHHPDRSAERAGLFRRVASARAGALGADGPLIAFEVILDRIPGRQGEADPRQAGDRALGIPAGVARFCLHRRSQPSRPATSCARRRASTRS